MKADLHVHSYHSGYATHLRMLKARDSYSDPFDIYRVAKGRGMDLVCITDHDSIDGCLEFLDRHPDAPDFIMGEEIECLVPCARSRSGRDAVKVHLGVIGHSERIHRDIQPLRGNVFDAAAYLRQQNVFFAINHLFFFFHDQFNLGSYVEDMLALSGAAETRNGAMLERHNELVERLARARTDRPILQVSGSDAHALARVGLTYTEVPARNREEFLANLKAGLGRPGGAHGSVPVLAVEIYTAIAQYWAALFGLRRHDLSVSRRLFGLAFSIVSLPFQFIPGAIAINQKLSEDRRIERYRRLLTPLPGVPVDRPAPAAPGDGSHARVART